MKLDVTKLDALIGQEESAQYWREKAECLEEWVCELLTKNEALRMDLENEQSQSPHREGTSSFSLPGLHQSPLHSGWLAFGTGSLKFIDVGGSEPCPRRECAEIRKLVLQFAAMKDIVPEESS
jgi:hypothetical protein